MASEKGCWFFFFFPLTYITSSRLGDFPGGPVVKTPRFLVEELRFYTTCAKLFQSCPTLCDPLDCSPPCSSVPGILQAKIQDWVAILFIRGSSQPRAQTHVSCVLFSSVESLNHVQLFETPWTAACQASLSITNSSTGRQIPYHCTPGKSMLSWGYNQMSYHRKLTAPTQYFQFQRMLHLCSLNSHF